MDLLNGTGMPAAYTLGMDPDGRERVVVVVKGTFGFPTNGTVPTLLPEQVPLVMADEFTGEPGYSATTYEAEFAPYKHKCDVVVNGSAYAPGGVPTTRVRVGIRVGAIEKALDVVGDRVWTGSGVPSEPATFVRMPLSYDRAYGGADQDPRNPDVAQALTANPVGCGYYPISKNLGLAGLALPNTEETGVPAASPDANYRPMALGAIGRHFGERLRYAGTYDEHWQEHVFPFLPEDFDSRYYQCAPADQQMDFPRGGETVDLFNLTPEGRTQFELPRVLVPVEFTNADYERTAMSALLDTIVIEPDLRRILMIWRASIPLTRNIFELRQCVVGQMPRGWYRARDLGKDYYGSLGEYISSRREEEPVAP